MEDIKVDQLNNSQRNNCTLQPDEDMVMTMFRSSLPPVVCRRAHVLFTLFVFVLQHLFYGPMYQIRYLIWYSTITDIYSKRYYMDKLRSIYYFFGDGPVHILPYDPQCHELFAIYICYRGIPN
jgi:hypothetical protein